MRQAAALCSLAADAGIAATRGSPPTLSRLAASSAVKHGQTVATSTRGRVKWEGLVLEMRVVLQPWFLTALRRRM